MFDIETKVVEPMTVAYVPMRGSLSQMTAGMDTLLFLAGATGYTQIGPPSAVYLNDPSIDEDNAAWELWLPINDIGVEISPGSSRLGVKRLPETTVATVTFTGPYGELGTVYDALAAWVIENGRTITGPPQEIYLTEPEQVKPADNVTEIRLPINAE